SRTCRSAPGESLAGPSRAAEPHCLTELPCRVALSCLAQQRSRETPSPQQLCEWYAGRQGSGGAGPCTCPAHRTGVAIFDLDFDAILVAMYAVSISAEGDCYVCVPPDPGIEAAALGASESAAPGAGESALSGTTSAQVFHTFTLDS
ncbi:unnamed protein product, partial [Closterium sp. NIES-53]